MAWARSRGCGQRAPGGLPVRDSHPHPCERTGSSALQEHLPPEPRHELNDATTWHPLINWHQLSRNWRHSVEVQPADVAKSERMPHENKQHPRMQAPPAFLWPALRSASKLGRF
jgi:hypothetical protein